MMMLTTARLMYASDQGQEETKANKEYHDVNLVDVGDDDDADNGQVDVCKWPRPRGDAAH